MKLNTKQYINYFATSCLMYIAILVVGAVLYSIDFGTYGEIIYNETQQWDKGVITEIQPSDSNQCPLSSDGLDKSELLSSLYLGTQTVCIKSNGDYIFGSCPTSKSSSHSSSRRVVYNGRTISGFPDTLIYSFGGNRLCYSRSNIENYHTILANRIINDDPDFKPSCQDDQQLCGPSNITLGDTYCTSEPKCPLYGLQAQPSSTQQTNLKKWNFIQSSNVEHSPMADLFVGLSPPCYDTQYNYQHRNTKISEVYDEGECPGEGINGSKAHPGYIQTGFVENEKDILQENNILQGVMEKVPFFMERELLVNNYQIYYKPYSSWSIECQKLHPSTEVSNQAVQIYEITQSTLYVWIISIVMLSVWFVSLIILLQAKKCSEFTFSIYCILSILITKAMFILAIVYYSFLLKDMIDINRQHITDYVQNQCSDDLLNYSFNEILKDYDSMIKLTVLGLVVVSICLIISLISTIKSFNSEDSKEHDKHSESYGTFIEENQEINQERSSFEHKF